ncbi:hypothetical protein LCGC14_0946010 [marine sediment metagenome]|uniref:Uncharacterized protein n=1 Tax=marine sediment metagenome TaxID=412755 RepID=A0A0F9NIQ4_9ZZZZ
MCDCYEHKCEYCSNELSIHVADFCTKRKNISVVCPDCQEPQYPLRPQLDVSSFKQLYVCTIEFQKQVSGKLKDGKYKGKVVLIFCKDANAYGIYLN